MMNTTGTNICTNSDSYKCCHHNQYPEGLEYLYSYFESRNGAKYPETVFATLQPLLIKNLEGQVVTEEKIVRAKALVDAHLGPGVFNEKMWRYILKEHDGRLPIRIKAVPEGTAVPTNNVLMTVENTDPKVAPLTNYLETLLTHVWYGSTVATLSRETKKLMQGYLERTSDTQDGLQFMLHDFGARGVSSTESAAFGGFGHLINFLGTDTVVAIELAMEYYGSDVCAFSVPATEHSVMTSRGRDGEVEVVRNLLKNHPTGILSVVGDSYDIFNFAENIMGETFYDEIMARDGVFVLRPDSGDPVSTVVRLLEILEDNFGTTKNSKGFRVLNPKVRLIWGDGINQDGINDILGEMEAIGFSAENIVFGMGGGLLQRVNRDTQRFAFKASWMQINGEGKNIYKNPVDQSKVSKKGRLALIINEDGEYETLQKCKGPVEGDLLQTVFEDGAVIKRYTMDEVRASAAI